ncbi:MAG: hypothetical protein UT32_C0008G0035 [Parcubacteria group bacterium GW2011_GWC2_39_14]|nr:MAG: hypothetical protein UT32_C0008G0035 [Parcubacteria group bacterium GW2011_GWC2_39_14]KKR54900.1 MAG: hypothetical protein UT91_C0007G0001 [Parcubacteria group bacterium GW2011_GWA2_40_23]
MKRTHFENWFLVIGMILALTMLACGGGNNTGNDGVDPDVANDNDCSNCAEADVAGDEQTEPDNETPDADVHETETTTPCEYDEDCQSTATTIYGCWHETLQCIPEHCNENSDCEDTPNAWCDKYIGSCRPEGMLSLLEPYRFLEGNWRCTEGGEVGYMFPLEILGWDTDTQSAKMQLDLGGVLQNQLTFQYDGDSLLLVSATLAGVEPWYNPQYDAINRVISFDDDPEGQVHWSFQKQW